MCSIKIITSVLLEVNYFKCILFFLYESVVYHKIYVGRTLVNQFADYAVVWSIKSWCIWAVMEVVSIQLKQHFILSKFIRSIIKKKINPEANVGQGLDKKTKLTCSFMLYVWFHFFHNQVLEHLYFKTTLLNGIKISIIVSSCFIPKCF